MGRYHDGPCDYHPPYLVTSVAPTTAGLGYPLRIGDIWLDVSGGIGVQRRCTVVLGDGTGTWVLDGPAVVKLPLGHADTAGGVLAWRNPEGAAVIVTALTLRYTTPTTDPEFGNTIAVGDAVDGTTVSAAYSSGGSTDNDVPGELIVHAVPTVAAPIVPVLLAAGRWITASKAAGSMAGLAGFAYVYYHLA